MKTFVLWTGWMSVAAGASLQFPSLAAHLMPSEPPGMLLHLFGLMAMYLGVLLVFCSRDLARRGTLVLWEGILRLGGFGVMAGYGLFGGGGAQLALGGLFDLIVGVIYLVALPRHLGSSFVDLLRDRSASRAPTSR